MGSEAFTGEEIQEIIAENMFKLQAEQPAPPGREEKTQRLTPANRKPAKSRLPWFRCRRCQARLLPMDVVDGRTCVRVAPYAVSYKIEVTCERCGETREFVSMAVS